MNQTKPLFIADSCIGGLSVLKSIWSSGSEPDVVFLADYAINPLGVKSESGIAEVAGDWLKAAGMHSDTLVIGCNTLSIRYEQLDRFDLPDTGPKRVISMVDCFRAMVETEADRLTDRRVLIIGTAFTASQPVYPDILTEKFEGLMVSAVAATELERAIARFQPWDSNGNSVITDELRRALENTDIAVLACTCFPMVRDQLEEMFPRVEFLDPGAYCLSLLDCERHSKNRKLDLKVTGDVVLPETVRHFTESYLQQFG